MCWSRPMPWAVSPRPMSRRSPPWMWRRADAQSRQQGGSDGQRPCRELRHQGRYRPCLGPSGGQCHSRGRWPTAKAISRSPPRRWASAIISTMPSRSRASRPMPRWAESCSRTISTSMPRPSIRVPAGCWRWVMRDRRPIAALPSTAISRSRAISPATALVAGSLHLAHVVQLYQRFGSASLHIDAQHGDVSLGGVSVLANAKLTGTGTPMAGNGIGSLGTAGAWADAHINARNGRSDLGRSRACRRECHGRGPWRLAHRARPPRGLRRRQPRRAGNVTINAQVSAPERP